MAHHQNSKEVADEESCPLVDGAHDSGEIPSRHLTSQGPNKWKYTTFILAFLLLAIGIRDYIQSRHELSRQYSYETGFETDWSLTRDIIRTKKVKFSGGIQFAEDGETYMTPSPDGEPTYVGPPSQEIDDAWDVLTRNLTIAVSREEAKAVSDRAMYDKYRGHYSVAVSVLHSLHCINAIRIALDVDYYREKGFLDAWWKRLHIDHCLNHIRQTVQCHGDLTPIPLIPASKNESKKGWITPDFDQYHTCRDFTAIREWSDEKHATGMRNSAAQAASHNMELSD
ncbi:hypothetical protein E8E14_012212 [Neopestalotiopsis sp. 37M]|nr:hypothetical protein E8E14_012212 [Neopestalotiopsis sp. 37M]